jgi:hypothetical protein
MLKGDNKAEAQYLIERDENTDNIGYIPVENLNLAVKDLDGMAVHPDAVSLMESMFKDRYRNPIVNTLEAINNIAKKLNLSYAFFHHMTLLETAIGTLTRNPRSAAKLGKALSDYKQMWAAIKQGSYPVMLKNWDSAIDFLEHTGQLGDISDAHRDLVDKTIAKFESGAKALGDFVGAGKVTSAPFTALRGFNSVLDKFLWDYLHNVLKVHGYENALESNTRRFEKKYNRTANDREMKIIKLETANQINNTFGGQNWKAMMTNPRMMQLSQGLMLSPDWTVSTGKQFLSITGLTSITKTPLGREMVKSMGRKFWAKSFILYGTGLQLLNAYFRQRDDEDEWEAKQDALNKKISGLNQDIQNLQSAKISPRIREKRRERFTKEKSELTAKLRELEKNEPKFDITDPERVFELSTFGNVSGKKFSIFFGKNKFGKEIYRGFGKQFKDVPEYVFALKDPANPDFLPEVNLIKSREKIATKSSPIVRIASLVAFGESITAFVGDSNYGKEIREARKKYGGVQIGTTLKYSLLEGLPFQLSGILNKEFPISEAITKAVENKDWKEFRILMNQRKEFSPVDLITSQSIGVYKKAVEKAYMRAYLDYAVNAEENGGHPTKDAIKKFEARKDRIWKSALKNNINPESVIRPTVKKIHKEILKQTRPVETLWRTLTGKKARTIDEERQMIQIEKDLAKVKQYSDDYQVYQEYTRELEAIQKQKAFMIYEPYEETLE